MSDLDTVSKHESQAWVKAFLPEWDYADDYDETLLGEDDAGWILARRDGTDDYWEAFDVTDPRHRAQAEESKRRGIVVFLDLEQNGDEA